jgi:hypothetical protein
MADKNKTDPQFQNADTIRRRAWIDRAIAGARRRIAQTGEPEAPDAARSEPRLAIVRFIRDGR